MTTIEGFQNLLTARELSVKLGSKYAVSTLLNYAREDRIPAIKVGSSWYFKYEEVMDSLIKPNDYQKENNDK